MILVSSTDYRHQMSIQFDWIMQLVYFGENSLLTERDINFKSHFVISCVLCIPNYNHCKVVKLWQWQYFLQPWSHNVSLQHANASQTLTQSTLDTVLSGSSFINETYLQNITVIILIKCNIYKIAMKPKWNSIHSLFKVPLSLYSNITFTNA